MIKKLFAVLPLSLLLTSCAAQAKPFDYNVDISGVIPAYDIMMERYGIVKSVAETKWDSFSIEEQKTLNLIANHVRMIDVRINRIRNSHISNMEGVRVSVPELGYLYTLAHDAYDMSHKIAMNHIGELTSTEILTLQNFDVQLKDLDIQIRDLTTSSAQYEDVDHLLYKMINISSAALKIIIPVVLGREIYAGQE